MRGFAAIRTNREAPPQAARRRLRVAYFIDSDAINGVERHVLALADGLDRAAYEPILFCYPHDGLHLFLDEVAGRDIRICIASQDGGRGQDSRTCRYSPGAGLTYTPWFRGRVRDAARLLRGHAIDLIHFQAGRPEAIAPVMVAAAQVGIRRRTLTMNNLFSVEGDTPLQGLICRRALRFAHAVVAVSEAVRRCCVQELRVPADRIAVIPYGFPARPSLRPRKWSRCARFWALRPRRPWWAPLPGWPPRKCSASFWASPSSSSRR